MSLTSQARADLVGALQPHVKAMAANLQKRLAKPTTRTERNAQEAAKKLHQDERAGATFRVWLDLLSRRAAVSWVLKLVYIRVLEDRDLIAHRLISPTHRALFTQLAPSLGDAAYLAWTFTDLSCAPGLSELFADQPAEVLRPADDLCRALFNTLCATNPDTSTRDFDFSGETFDGQLMGDLYQELDPVVKDRFALLQTPDFVRAFMLDRTLTEALKTWPATDVRVIDPACGSGHFLIDAFRRLVTATTEAEPEWTRLQVVQSALERVVGLDLNDAAANLARTRLLMTAVELLAEGGEPDLAVAAELKAHVYWADGLEQHEKGLDSQGSQMVFAAKPVEIPRATFTPVDTRKALIEVLSPRFHVVVANPPYITEKDAKAKKYHKEKINKKPRYVSAFRTYSLGAPFTERTFQLAVPGGFIGVITANSFAKREFGRPVVEEVLANKDVTLLVDTSGAYIPGHGTPTILIFGRNQAPEGDTMTAVLGKRGEPSNPENASQGKVWTSICEGFDTPNYESPFVSTEAVTRKTFAEHPWSLRGGGALSLQALVESRSDTRLGSLTVSVGRTGHTGNDQAMVASEQVLRRFSVEDEHITKFVPGGSVRDYGIYAPLAVVFAHNEDLSDKQPFECPDVVSWLWPYRTMLWERKEPNGTHRELGMPWVRMSRFHPERFVGLGIGFAFVATHNHFVLDRGGKVFKQSAPVIKLPADATVDDHLALLGSLNSSAACFWMKQNFQAKGGSGQGRGVQAELWQERYEHDSTKLARFPLPPTRDQTIPWAKALDALGHKRAEDTAAAVLSADTWTDTASLRVALNTRIARDIMRLREMVAHQEELDWLVYRLYGLVDDSLPVAQPSDTQQITPGTRPFELRLAADEPETAWFTRHGWEPRTELPNSIDAATRNRVEQRLAAIEASAHLRLLEQPVHKRRWYKPDYEDQNQQALRTWLLDTVEAVVEKSPAPMTPAQVARSITGDARVDAVFDLLDDVGDRAVYLAKLMADESVAAHPVHRYTSSGMVKRKAWEDVWRLQAAEDRGEDVGKIKVPPKYTGKDFIGSVAYPLRGKLDVPKERFVAHTEIPTSDGERRTGEDALYGWAGWTREQRFQKLYNFLDTLDQQSVSETQRVGLYDLMFRYLADLARTNPSKASDLSADLQGDAGGKTTEDQLAAWLVDHPATVKRGRGRSQK